MLKQTDLAETIVLNSDDNLFVDVDETLVLWNIKDYPNDTVVQVRDPYMDDAIIELVPHKRHIELLKRCKGQGRKIVVWSAGGYAWAQRVVEALGIAPYVHLIMAKPIAYMDDKDMTEWRCQRIYLSKNLPKSITE